MSRRPEMVSGARSPKEAAQRKEREAQKATAVDQALEALNLVKESDAVARSRPVGVREFGALFHGLMLTIKRADEIVVNGITIPARLQTVRFEDGVLRTSDPIVIAAIENHKGYGRDMWDADVLKEKAERVAAEGFLARVDDLPFDIKEQLRVKLGMEDFPLPPPEPGSIVEQDPPSA
jgi:hypothetical protein